MSRTSATRCQSELSLRQSLLSNHDWRRLRAWHRRYDRRFPWRKNATPWSILLTETLLHRTRADAVRVLYPKALQMFPSPNSIGRKKDRWISMSHKAGLFWRSRIFVRACQVLVRQHGGHVPSSVKELEGLPGVGHYTASAVRCFGFGYREFITDTNTIRLAGRLAGKRLDPAHHRTKRIRSLVARLRDSRQPPLPKDNYALLDLAAILCKPREPLCHECPLQSSCHTGQFR